MLVLLVVPSVLLGDLLVSGAQKVMDFFQKGELHIPPPPDSVAGWPLIGEPIAKTWTLASEDLEKALHQASPLLKGLREPGSSVPPREPGLRFCSLFWRYSSLEAFSPNLRPWAV